MSDQSKNKSTAPTDKEKRCLKDGADFLIASKEDAQKAMNLDGWNGWIEHQNSLVGASMSNLLGEIAEDRYDRCMEGVTSGAKKFSPKESKCLGESASFLRESVADIEKRDVWTEHQNTFGSTAMAHLLGAAAKDHYDQCIGKDKPPEPPKTKEAGKPFPAK